MRPIALITDFGLDDYFVGAMKGVILSINPQAAIVDITHNIRPQDIRSAAFTLAACWRDFPEATIFVAVVDPGVGTRRHAILAEADGKYFVAPDNGMLSFVLDATRELRTIRLTNRRYFREPVSSTFHGRDIFAPVAAHLSTGVDPADFGPDHCDPVLLPGIPVTGKGKIIEAEVIHIDRFGNLITNLTRRDLPPQFVIEVKGRRITRLAEYYAGEAAGEIFAIFGSAGFLEISANRDSAAELLNAEVGARVLVTGYDIKVV